MKKNILIGLLALVSVSTSVFAFYQRNMAQQYRLLAIENKIKSEEMSRLAEDRRAIAHQQFMEQTEAANKERLIRIMEEFKKTGKLK